MKRFFNIICITIIMLGSFGGCYGEEINYSSNIAKNLLMQGKYTQAIDQYNELIKKQPDVPDYWNNKGVALLRLQRCEEALSSFLRVAELEPGTKSGRINAAQAYLCQGKAEEAEEQLYFAVTQDPKDISLWKEIGKLRREKGSPETALQAYIHASELNNSDPDIFYNIGELSFQLNQYENATKSYEKIVEITPDDELAWFNLGVNYEAGNQFRRALDAYNKTLELNSSNYKAWSNIANIYYEHNRFNETLLAINKVIEIYPGFSDAWFIRAISQRYLGDINNSVYSFEQASALAPNDSLKKAYYQKYMDISQKSQNGTIEQDTPVQLWIIFAGILAGILISMKTLHN